MRYEYTLNIEGLKVGSVYVLNRDSALNNRVCLTTRVYRIGFLQITSGEPVTANFTTANFTACTSVLISADTVRGLSLVDCRLGVQLSVCLVGGTQYESHEKYRGGGRRCISCQGEIRGRPHLQGQEPRYWLAILLGGYLDL